MVDDDADGDRAPAGFPDSPAIVPYTWQNVEVGAGGYAPNIVFSQPSAALPVWERIWPASPRPRSNFFSWPEPQTQPFATSIIIVGLPVWFTGALMLSLRR